MKLIGTADKAGVIRFPDFGVFVKAQHLAGKVCTVEVEELKNRRSTPQNKYYFGCVVPIFQKIFNELGNRFSKEQTHEILAMKFLLVPGVVKDGQREADKICSTTELTREEFSDYIHQLQQWGSEVFHAYIPDPGEQIKIETE